jgi:hypothetical protein
MDNAVTTTGESHERELSGCVGPNDTPQMHQHSNSWQTFDLGETTLHPALGKSTALEKAKFTYPPSSHTQ